MGLSLWSNLWVLIAGEVVGALVAATAYRLINGTD
jgi:glycerol uptake facilitator-like aquaporin